MNYKTRIIHITDSGDGVSVEAEVNGEVVAHTFPKGLGFFGEPDEGKPKFVGKLEDKYDEKIKREGKMPVQEISAEEAKIQSAHFKNREYGTENFKQEENRHNIMANIDTGNPEEIRSYLKENMAEGYLSEEEGLNIDEFVDQYAELLDVKENLQGIIRKVYETQVQ